MKTDMEPFSFEELPMAVTKLYGKMKKIEKLLRLNFKRIADRDELMDIEAASKLLKLSIATIYSKVCRRELPANKQGKKLYFSKNELQEWIKTGRTDAGAGSAAKAEAYIKENKLGSARKGKVT